MLGNGRSVTYGAARAGQDSNPTLSARLFLCAGLGSRPVFGSVPSAYPSFREYGVARSVLPCFVALPESLRQPSWHGSFLRNSCGVIARRPGNRSSARRESRTLLVTVVSGTSAHRRLHAPFPHNPCLYLRLRESISVNMYPGFIIVIKRLLTAEDTADSIRDSAPVRFDWRCWRAAGSKKL